MSDLNVKYEGQQDILKHLEEVWGEATSRVYYTEEDLNASVNYGKEVQYKKDVKAMAKIGIPIETIAKVMDCSVRDIEFDLDESYVLN